MKRLFRADITVMLYAEDQAKARETLRQSELEGDLREMIRDADIYPVDAVPSEWYDELPFGLDEDDPEMTCGEILRARRSEK